jgi:hypothetical protein
VTAPGAAAALLLALPGVTEADHHGRRSFRVGGTAVLATVPDDGVVHLMVGEDVARASAGRPGVELLWWGSRISGVRVDLAAVDPAAFEELAEAAWERRAPASLRRGQPRGGRTST